MLLVSACRPEPASTTQPPARASDEPATEAPTAVAEAPPPSPRPAATGTIPETLTWVALPEEAPYVKARPAALVEYEVEDESFERVEGEVEVYVDYFKVVGPNAKLAAEMNELVRRAAVDDYETESWSGYEGIIEAGCEPFIVSERLFTFGCSRLEGVMDSADLEEGLGGSPNPEAWVENYAVQGGALVPLRWEALFGPAGDRQTVWSAAVIMRGWDEDEPRSEIEPRLAELDSTQFERFAEGERPAWQTWTFDYDGLRIFDRDAGCLEDECNVGHLGWDYLMMWAAPEGPLPAHAYHYFPEIFEDEEG